jgi:hypothetical protein
MNDLSSQTPPVIRTVHVPLPPDQAFTVFTEQIGQ